jgi:His/Glu/Gln/Arg/opine family amino acid ABC transporter permease subunit
MILQGYLPQLLLGVIITIKVAVLALLFGLMLGLIGALAESSKIRWLRYLFISWNSVIRGVPELLVLFFIYFGSSEVMNKIFNYTHNVSAFAAGVIALGFIFAAYAAQTFRGAFLAISRGQTEAAHALGFSRWQAFRLIQLPQAWRHALPGLSNLWLVLLKDTALVSLIGLSDLMMRAQTGAVSTGRPFAFYVTASIIYLILTSVSEIILKYLTLRANRYL